MQISADARKDALAASTKLVLRLLRLRYVQQPVMLYKYIWSTRIVVKTCLGDLTQCRTIPSDKRTFATSFSQLTTLKLTTKKIAPFSSHHTNAGLYSISF
jgi:hypothetical protein